MESGRPLQPQALKTRLVHDDILKTMDSILALARGACSSRTLCMPLLKFERLLKHLYKVSRLELSRRCLFVQLDLLHGEEPREVSGHCVSSC